MRRTCAGDVGGPARREPTGLDASLGRVQHSRAVVELESRLELLFSGIHFIFEGPDALLAALERVPCARRETGEALRGRADSEPSCLVSRLVALDAPDPHRPPQDRRLGWAWQGGRAVLRSRHASAELEGPPAATRGEARLTPNRRGAESLLTGLCGALLHRMGGTILHAASLELQGSVIALIGPSGAGKSTASRQLEGGRVFSVDRLAIAPAGQQGWLAFPLPGGTRSALDPPASSSVRAPLAAVLRIRKAARGVWLEPCAPAQAVALLRQSAFHSGLDAQAEQELLTHLERLAGEVPVANLHSSLGTLFGPALGRWLAHRQTAAADQGQISP